MLAGDFQPGFPLRLAFKDVILAMDTPPRAAASTCR
jgi:3-hydroxyisobutyrate dehydrogenase-like beta-hydroxyacid dehydrogenase